MKNLIFDRRIQIQIGQKECNQDNGYDQKNEPTIFLPYKFRVRVSFK